MTDDQINEIATAAQNVAAQLARQPGFADILPIPGYSKGTVYYPYPLTDGVSFRSLKTGLWCRDYKAVGVIAAVSVDGAIFTHQPP
jgi:hypothetical protein